MAASVLPIALLSLFQPRPPLECIPVEKEPSPSIGGVSDFLNLFDSSAPTSSHQYINPNPLLIKQELERKKTEKERLHFQNLQNGIHRYNPDRDPNIVSDPYKTIFVGRLDYSTTEEDLRSVFEPIGPVRTVFLPKRDKTRTCGYAFVEFLHESDCVEATRSMRHVRIKNRQAIVDQERSRKSPNWLPRRLGGGVGTGRSKVQKRIEVEPRRRDDRRRDGYRREDHRRERDNYRRDDRRRDRRDYSDKRRY
ncbi:hypothetical protein RCL1_004184 [Eukaryota sp. TZLM3-RCL]